MLTLFIDANLALGIGLGVGIPLLLIVSFAVLFLMRGQRYRRSLNDLSGRYESSHGILLGKISQYISRLESICQRNFSYSDSYIQLNNKFKDLKDYKDAECSGYIKQLANSLNDHDYRAFRQSLPEARRKISDFENTVSSFSRSLSLKFEDENRAQTDIAQSKAALRKIKEEYYSFQSDVGMLVPTFEAFFSRSDSLLSEADSLIDRASYDDAEEILTNKLNPALRALDGRLSSIPEMCLQLTNVLPDKLISLKNAYQELSDQGYPLHHVVSEQTIARLEEEISKMSDKLRGLSLGGLKERIDELSNQIQSYFDAFEEEKKARAAFEENCSEVYRSASKLDNDFLQLNHAIPKAEQLYLFDEQDKAEIEAIVQAINRAGATKRRLDNLIHSGTHQPFSVLLARMEELRKECDSTKAMMTSFTDKLRNFKTDVEKANSSIETSLTAVREAEADIASVHIDAVGVRFLPLCAKIRASASEISSLLHALPIDVKKVDVVYASLTSDLAELETSLSKALSDMKEAEATIVRANRYRGGNEALADALSQAETLFYEGDFERAARLASDAVGETSGLASK